MIATLTFIIGLLFGVLFGSFFAAYSFAKRFRKFIKDNRGATIAEQQPEDIFVEKPKGEFIQVNQVDQIMKEKGDSVTLQDIIKEDE